ncbi:unnamed protein product [Adineta ricciae]|uniref:ACB domain-containing protein n=1 Tax=Adineta ricciae TaxID=249248 RepID=A0A815FXY8_ADIRI|nr:unnamed protein product [Adineta ricciae]
MNKANDEIFTDNFFGQVIVAAPNSNQIMSSTPTKNSDTITDENHSPTLVEEFGFPMDDLFNMARHFLKEKQGSKAIQLKYADNIRFAALTKQATIGKWDASYTQNVGLLDVVGNDRKQAWIALGDMSQDRAKEEFIKFLFERCPTFRLHLEAHHVENEEKDRLRKEDEIRRSLEQEAQQARQHELEQVSRLEEQRKKREEFQRKQIQDALNQQTYPQFKAYAEQQYRDNRQAQDELIRQLQEQHFQQYMQQVYHQQLIQQQQTKPTMEQQSTSASATNGNNKIDETKHDSSAPLQTQFESLSLNTPLQQPSNNDLNGTQESTDDNDTDINAAAELAMINDDGTREYPAIVPANMWTRKDMKEFKDAVRKEKDAVIKIGSGETVTVRVPTHEDGRCIFWEFATDYYDIGFGVYFEWSKVQSNTVTVHVSDSSEEEDEEGEDGTNPEKKDIEKGSSSSNKPPKPYQDEIVPIFRRESHEEIYAGSHQYPDMNEFEQLGAQELLSLLGDDELMSVKETVTKSIIKTNTKAETIDACLKCSQSAMQLLRRKKIRRDILMQYLARKSIPVVAGTDKVRLIKQIIEFWNSGSSPAITANQAVPTILPTIYQLSHQFTEWFYTSWNTLTTFSPEHFFPDCELTLVHENQHRVLGSYYVCDILRSYVATQNLRFCPNIPSNKAEESKHGLVLVQIHGTIHQHGTCVGIFDQAFGLVRDPNHSNNYLIKFTFLNMQTQTAQQQSQLLSANHPTPSYLVDILQNYDTTIQQQIDSTDYIIDEGDDNDDGDDSN